MEGDTMIIQIVRYKSGLTHEQVAERFQARSAGYRTVPGLVQKYYVHFASSGEHGGVYVWDSSESLQRWRETTLAGTLAETYEVEEPPAVELADVMLVLHPERLSKQAS
jgi:heme-degrading monooxygenase HmoA